ncbi:hypothetical protein C8R44DRAFT_785579 [Mycena epipterygia]|nr:hypothetical protein C8R44DRAFT_785579 [Mycena epipterygia]
MHPSPIDMPHPSPIDGLGQPPTSHPTTPNPRRPPMPVLSFRAIVFRVLLLPLLFPSLALLPVLLVLRLFRRVHLSVKRKSNVRFHAVHKEDGIVISPDRSLQVAIVLAENALHALPVTSRLSSLIEEIFEAMRRSLTPGSPLPTHVYRWRTWLLSEHINIIFSPHYNQTRWGWVTKEDEGDRPDFSARILLDLAELTERDREDHHLTAQHFRFCFVVTALHELTHLLTKYAFPHIITPKVLGTILHFGEAGEGFEHHMLGGKLVCEWDKGYEADFRHLHQLYIRKLDTEEDYPLEDVDIVKFLENIRNPTPTTNFDISFANKTPSTIPEGRTRTIAESDRIRTYTTSQSKGKQVWGLFAKAEVVDVDSPYVKTGAMLGIGKCYDRRL